MKQDSQEQKKFRVYFVILMFYVDVSKGNEKSNKKMQN